MARYICLTELIAIDEDKGGCVTAVKSTAYLTVASVYVLILIGGYITSAGLGLSGGRDWPLPREGFLPTMDSLAEYVHRAWTLVVSFLILSTMILSWRHRRWLGGSIPIVATLPTVLLGVQIPMGMITLYTGLNPFIVTLHLGLAVGIFGSTLTTAMLIRDADEKSQLTQRTP